jgi:hypothetical protein
LADDHDLQRRQLSRQILRVGERQEMRFAQAGDDADSDDEKRKTETLR